MSITRTPFVAGVRTISFRRPVPGSVATVAITAAAVAVAVARTALSAAPVLSAPAATTFAVSTRFAALAILRTGRTGHLRRFFNPAKEVFHPANNLGDRGSDFLFLLRGRRRLAISALGAVAPVALRTVVPRSALSAALSATAIPRIPVAARLTRLAWVTFAARFALVARFPRFSRLARFPLIARLALFPRFALFPRLAVLARTPVGLRFCGRVFAFARFAISATRPA